MDRAHTSAGVHVYHFVLGSALARHAVMRMRVAQSQGQYEVLFGGQPKCPNILRPDFWVNLQFCTIPYYHSEFYIIYKYFSS